MDKLKQITYYKNGVKFEANSVGFILTSVNGNKVIFNKQGEVCTIVRDKEKEEH